MTDNRQKLALITGASKGLGRTLAQFLALRGYDLIITARHAEPLNAVANDLTTEQTKVHAVVGDVSASEHQQALLELIQDYGALDVLINNASILGTLPMPTLVDHPLADLQHIFDINVIAPLALIQQTLPYLQAAQGLVINLSSDAAVGGYATWGGYGASKAALDLISATLANELQDKGISSVSVDPGDMRTTMHQDAFPNEDISDRPLPDVTLPFWAWLFGQDAKAISGRRFQAQAELWEVTA